MLNGGAGANTDVGSAVPAPARHRLRVGNRAGPDRTAIAATVAVRPDMRLEPRDGCFLVIEHLEDLEQHDSTAVRISRHLPCHGLGWTGRRGYVKLSV